MNEFYLIHLMKGVVVLLLLLVIPLGLAAHIRTQPAPGIPMSKIVFVDKGRENVKTPYGNAFIRKTTDNRLSRFRPETYQSIGEVGVLEKASKPVNFKAPEGYFGYGMGMQTPMISKQGTFRNFKLIYGIDTQIIKNFKEE